MAELRLNDEQQQRLGNLLSRLAEDEALKTRLEMEPRAVLNEFGLGSLLPEGQGLEDIQVRVEQPEVAGYLLHADWHSNGHLDGHQDWHSDVHGDAPVFRGASLAGLLPSINIVRDR